MMEVKIDIDPNGDGGFSFSPCFRKICGRVLCLNSSSTWPALSRLNEEADHYDAAESGVRVITSPGRGYTAPGARGEDGHIAMVGDKKM